MPLKKLIGKVIRRIANFWIVAEDHIAFGWSLAVAVNTVIVLFFFEGLLLSLSLLRLVPQEALFCSLRVINPVDYFIIRI